MAQVTIDLPDDLEARVRREARLAGQSLSGFLTELVSARLRQGQWPEGFRALYGSWEGDFPVPPDAPPSNGPKG
jgi:hypothetical protein